MPSRRIGSNINLCPRQEITVNPFDTFNSDTVNKLTRMISNNKDGVLHGLDVKTPIAYPEIIYSTDIFNSGDEYKEDLWSYEEDNKFEPVLSTDNLKLGGFKASGLTKITSQSVFYIYKPTDTNIEQYLGTHTKSIFNFSFKLLSGTPYKVIVSVDDDCYEVKYPRIQSDVLTFDVEHDLTNNTSEKGIRLGITFIMNPEDYNSGTYGSNIIKKPYYNGQSEIVIGELHYSVSILSYENKIDYNTHVENYYGDGYPTSAIHPSNKLIITQGMAIKDDVLIQEYSKDKCKHTPTMVLDVSNKLSWIKNNPFKAEEFYKGGATQTAFILNKQNAKKITGSVDLHTSDLIFNVNGTDLLPLDDYTLSTECLKLPINISRSIGGQIVTNEEIYDDKDDMYGNVAYITTRSGKIIQKINVNYTLDGSKKKYSSHVIHTDIPHDIEDIEIRVICGPIKVSGYVDEYNSDMVQWANVVLYYTYFKHPTPNKSYIGLIRDEDLLDLRFREDYIILARVRFISPNMVDLISYENRQEIYTPISLARNIDYKNQLLPEYHKFWINPNTKLQDVPTNVSDALTKLASWINTTITNIIDDSDLYKNDVVYNKHEYLVENQLITYQVDDKTNKKGHLKSKYIVDSTNISSEDNHIPESKLIHSFINTITSEQTEQDNRLDDLEEEQETQDNRLDDLEIEQGTQNNRLDDLDEEQDEQNNRLGDLETCKQDKLSGNEGTVLYCNGNNNLQFRPILNDNQYVCLTPEEVDMCKNNGIDYNYIMQKWIKWGMANGKQYGLDNYTEYVGEYKESEIGVTRWTWDNENKCIKQPVNTVDTTGFATYNPSNNIDISVRFFSDDDDNDEAGVALLVYDSSGRHHVISFMRNLLSCAIHTDKVNNYTYTDDVGEYNFKCYLDAGGTKNSIKLDSKCETVKQYDADHNEILTKSYFAYDYDSTKGNTSSTTKAYIYKNIDGEKTCPVYRRVLEDVLMQPDRTKSQFNDEGNIAVWQQTVEKTMDDPTYFRGWRGYYGGVQLNLIYKKSDPDKDNHTTITCRTTPFYENKDQKDYIYNDTYSITLDIDELCNDETKTEEVRNIFKLFKNGCRWGVVTLSQPNLTFKLIDINTDEYNIIDIPNKIVWKYINGEWVDSGDSIYNYIFAGTQYYNSITDSMYWSDINKTVTHLTFGNVETWTFEDFDGNTITKNILVR